MDSPSAMIVIVYFLICGALAFIPGTIPFEYSKPTQQNYEKCVAGTEVSDPEHLNIYDPEQLKSDWCSIAALTNQDIKISITELGGPEVRYYFTQTNELVLDRTSSKMDHQAFMFMLAHEYEHHRLSHGFYRHAYTLLLIITLVIGIASLYAFATSPRHHKFLLFIFIPISTYVMFFYAYKFHEIDADKAAFKHLSALAYDPTVAANNLLLFGTCKNLGISSSTLISTCIYKKGAFIDLHNCDPHPTIKERMKYLLN